MKDSMKQKRKTYLIRIAAVVLALFVLTAYTPMMADGIKADKETAFAANTGVYAAVLDRAPKAASTTYKISWKSKALDAGDQYTLKLYKVRGDKKTRVTEGVKWSSDKKSVASVSSSGKVTAKWKGTAVITAKYKGKSYKCTVKVTVPYSFYPVVTSTPYSKLNAFRTSKTWYWKKGNSSKKWVNSTSSNKLSKLKRDKKLEAVAKKRAKEISKEYSHTRPNGSGFWTAYPDEDDGYYGVGENLCMQDGKPNASEMMELFKETDEKYSGQGHRRNMLDPYWNRVGIACYYEDGITYWVQCFGEKY